MMDGSGSVVGKEMDGWMDGVDRDKLPCLAALFGRCKIYIHVLGAVGLSVFFI